MIKKKEELQRVALPNNTTEITRSFSRKLNIGNYESVDFFCSRKEQCSVDDSEETSERLHKFCMEEVEKSMEQYREQSE